MYSLNNDHEYHAQLSCFAHWFESHTSLNILRIYFCNCLTYTMIEFHGTPDKDSDFIQLGFRTGKNLNTVPYFT